MPFLSNETATTEMAGRTATLNVVFALTSIGLLLATTYMIWDDYNREWKQYQKRFNGLEVKLTQDQVQAQLAQGDKEIAARRGEVNQAEKDAAKLDADWYRVDQEYRFTKAEIDVARWDYEEAAHHGAKSAAARKRKLDDLENRWQKLKVEIEDINARKAAAAQ